MKRPFLLLCCLLALCACAAPGREGALGSSAPGRIVGPGGDLRQYRLWIGETPVLFDAAGGLLGKEEALTPLYDRGTGALHYYDLARYGRADGGPVQELHALYAPEGAQVCGWTPGRFEPAFGGLVILHDAKSAVDPAYLPADYATGLWDPRSGETIADGVASVVSLGNGTFAACDVSNRLLGVLDGEGSPISGFPPPASYRNPQGGEGMLLAYPSRPEGTGAVNSAVESGPGLEHPQPIRAVLLGPDLVPLLEAESLRFGDAMSGLKGPYLLEADGSRQRIYSLPDLEELLSLKSERFQLSYFDGERMILICREDGRSASFLYDAAARLLAGPFDLLKTENQPYDAVHPAAHFLARRGEEFFLLDRDGGVSASLQYPGLDSVGRLDTGLYTFQLRLSRSTDRAGTRVGLLGPDLEILLPADLYREIDTAGHDTGTGASPCPLLAASYTLPNETVRFDLLDRSGRVVLDRLSQIGTADADRAAVVRGSKMGLVDSEGNWISQYSIYSAAIRD